eukprot:9303824-Karenia_brevis.AAC.1
MEADPSDPPDDTHCGKRITEFANSLHTWPHTDKRTEMRTMSALNLDSGGSRALPKHVPWQERYLSPKLN